MFFIDLWGIDRKRVNLGLPYFSTKFWQGGRAEPTWQGLSHHCPNVNPLQNTCNGTVFVGKQMENKRFFAKDIVPLQVHF